VQAACLIIHSANVRNESPITGWHSFSIFEINWSRQSKCTSFQL